MADTPKYHPAFAITNVKSLLPITLDTAGMYHSWAALFKTWPIGNALMPRSLIGSTVLFLTTSSLPILLKDDTAQGAWARLESMFQDNKAARASHLEQEHADLDFENFTSIDDYCNHIKSLADRLADVDAPIPDTRLILKMTSGLPEAYAGTVDFIQNQEPLPSFESCRSRLKLAERTIKNRLAKEGGATSRQQAALISSTGSQNQADTSGNSSRGNTRNKQQKKSNSKTSNKGRTNGPAHQQSGPNPRQPWPISSRTTALSSLQSVLQEDFKAIEIGGALHMKLEAVS
uniref:Uncharacterized protein n=1 Tax=Chenopodium quinoa TaxID=63459 RepID=A0A803M8N7_CHEQI